MAEEKKGFILYADLIHTVEHLTDEQAGNLFKHILGYVNDRNPITENVITKLTFEPIRQQLKRDLTKYKGVKDKKSVSGREGNLKRWNEDVYKKYKEGKHTLEEAESIAQHRKVSHTDKVPSHNIANVAVNDNVNVNVNDNVNVNVNIKDISKPTAFSFFNSLKSLGVDENLINDWLKVRKTKKCVNTKTSWGAFTRELDKTTLTPNEVVKICCEKSWGGFNFEWLNVKDVLNVNPSNPTNDPFVDKVKAEIAMYAELNKEL